MTARADQGAAPAVGRPRLWFVVSVGPVAWFLHLLVSYLLVSYPTVQVTCAAGGNLLLHLVTVVATAAALTGGVMAWRAWQRLRNGEAVGRLSRHGLRPTPHALRHAGEDVSRAEPPGGRNRFMALYGVLSSSYFFLVILAQWLPVLTMSPCP